MSLSYQEMFQKIQGVISLLPTHFNRDESLIGARRETAEYACQQLKGQGAIMIAGVCRSSMR
ncbi:MAG: hypothetical protein ACLTNO_11040 [Blautia sp.]